MDTEGKETGDCSKVFVIRHSTSPDSHSAKRLPVTMEIKSKPQHARRLESSKERNHQSSKPTVKQSSCTGGIQVFIPCTSAHFARHLIPMKQPPPQDAIISHNSKAARLAIFDNRKTISQRQETVVFCPQIQPLLNLKGMTFSDFFPSFQEHIQYHVDQGQKFLEWKTSTSYSTL